MSKQTDRKEKEADSKLKNQVMEQFEEMRSNYEMYRKDVEENRKMFAATVTQSKIAVGPAHSETIAVSEVVLAALIRDDSGLTQPAVSVDVSKQESSIQVKSDIAITEKVEPIRKSTRIIKKRTRFNTEEVILEFEEKIPLSPDSKKKLNKQ